MPIKSKVEQIGKKPISLVIKHSSLNTGLVELGLKQRSQPKQTADGKALEFSFTLPNKKSPPPNRKAVLGLLENNKFKLIDINQTAKYGSIPMTLDKYGKQGERVALYHRSDKVFVVVHTAYASKGVKNEAR